MKVLISTCAFDSHAIAVQVCLEKLGVEIVRYFGADFPTKTTHSFEIGNCGTPRFTCKPLDIEGADVVWNRRTRLPYIPVDAVHEEDLVPVRVEHLLYHKAFWNYLAEKSFWINPARASRKAASKLTQLTVAKRLGFAIPDTLVSNDPNAIKRFIARPQVTVFKSFGLPGWDGKGKELVGYCAVVQQSDLPPDDILSATPGIYQQRIEKAYELRVTVMGRTCIAIKIDSTRVIGAETDWRSVHASQLPMQLHELPDGVTEFCLAYMKSFECVFGCFDFIVDAKGQYIFLEMNEQGQFLWIDDYCPDARLLSKFCEFILDPSPDFVTKNLDYGQLGKTIMSQRYRDLLHADHNRCRDDDEITRMLA